MSRHQTPTLLIVLTLALVLTACAPVVASPAPTTEPAATPAPTPTESPTEPPAAGGGMDPTAEPTAAPTDAPQLTLTAPGFENGGRIPVRFACQGQDVSPALDWNEPPPGTLSFVLILDDPDAVPVAGFVWDHWILFNLPADSRGLAENLPGAPQLTDRSRQGTNSFGRIGYAGPCPPSGQTHEYVFTLYALDTLLELSPGATKIQVLNALEGHVLAQAALSGLYFVP